MGAAGVALAVATFVFGVVLAGAFTMHMAGTLDPVIEWFTEKFLKAEARVEEKALEQAGSEKAQSILKERLENNPVVPNDEINEFSQGLKFSEIGKKFD